MKLRQIDKLQSAGKGIATILSADTPASLEISGDNVDGLPDAFILAAGSKLITATATYIAFIDGVFTLKNGSGGGGGDDKTSDRVGTGQVGYMILTS